MERQRSSKPWATGQCSSLRSDTTHTESLRELWFPLQTPDRFSIVDPLSQAFAGFEPSFFKRGDVEFIDMICRSRSRYGCDEAGYRTINTGWNMEKVDR
jgi:hypothetical protein